MIDLPPLLEPVDTDPDTWGPDHDELDLTPEELDALIEEGNRQGREVDVDDDEDNGL